MTEKIQNTHLSPSQQREIFNHRIKNSNLIPEPYKKVAQGMEQQFAEMMVKQMDKTVDHSDQSQASQIYRSLLDSERSSVMTKNKGGLGLQKLILDEIYPTRMRNEITYNAYMQEDAMMRKNAIEAYKKYKNLHDVGEAHEQ